MSVAFVNAKATHIFSAKKNVSSFCKCKSYSHFFSKNINIYAIFNNESFNDTLTNDIVSFEQLGPDVRILKINMVVQILGDV